MKKIVGNIIHTIWQQKWGQLEERKPTRGEGRGAFRGAGKNRVMTREYEGVVMDPVTLCANLKRLGEKKKSTVMPLGDCGG